MRRPRPDLVDFSPLGEQILDAVADGVVAVHRGGVILAANSAAERVLGLSRAAMLGARLSEVQPEGPLRKLFVRAMRTGKSMLEADAEIPRRYDAPARATVTATPLLDERGRRAGAVLTIQAGASTIHGEDERRRERLAQVGVLASGLAHEIKNPLGGIKGAAQLLQRELKETEPLAKHTEVIIKEANRVNDLIRRLLDLAKPRAAKAEEVNVNRLLNEILMLQQQTSEGRRVHIASEFDPSLPTVTGDEEQLTSVFLNIVRNALEASPFHGRVLVRTRVVTDYVLVGERGARRKVIRVDVEDDGPGVPPEEVEKLFTPFYTTKHGGTGLGLAISHQIVLDHRGRIEFHRLPMRGTRVQIYLPSAPSRRNGESKERDA